MIINEISIRGFKSYGNNEQILKLNSESGQLILLSGHNGSGKSSLLDSFDFTLFGKVRGKKKKWATLKDLPNRINGELLNKIKFTSNNTKVEVIRGVSPNKLELWENGVLNERAGKSNIDNKIQEYVGLDLETFKSFISMSINDFKNFISLTNEEKKILLDKLFNLEVINILNTITKEIAKENKIKISNLDTEINTLDESIKSIEVSIERAILNEKLNLESEISEIRELINSKKSEFLELKSKIEKIDKKSIEISSELDSEKSEYIKIENEIKNIDRQINLYNSSKCPTCSSDFNSDNFKSLKLELRNKKESLLNLFNEIKSNISNIREKELKLKKISHRVTESFNDLNYLLRGYRSKEKELIDKSNGNLKLESSNISEFENSIKELKGRKSESKKKTNFLKEKEVFYGELNKILSEGGIKRVIINNIINPINHFIDFNIKKMGINFQVELDESFQANIKSLNSEVDHDTLSTGETKLINICILVAYLKLIRTKRNINILFLDEVFSSIDIENIDKILNLLKSFASEYKVNIFVVHHAIMKQEMFDRIINIEKNIFSEIKEIELENNI